MANEDVYVVHDDSASLLQEISVINTSAGPSDIYKIRGTCILQDLDTCNQNKRIYRRAIGKAFVEQANDKIRLHKCIGEISHPLLEGKNPEADLRRQMTVDFRTSSHMFDSIWLDESTNSIVGTMTTLSNQCGTDLAKLAGLDEVAVGLSVRALGKTKPAGPSYPRGAVEVTAPVVWVTEDAVTDPSHKVAKLTKITETIRDSNRLKHIVESCGGNNIISESATLALELHDLFFNNNKNALDYLIETFVVGTTRGARQLSRMNPLQERRFVRASMDSLLQEFLSNTPETKNGKCSIDVFNESNVRSFMDDYSYRRNEYNTRNDVKESIKDYFNF